MIKLSKLKMFALLAALVAVAIKQKPHLLFKVPSVGFILHSIVTGEAPPPFIFADPWGEDELPTWIHDNDLVVAGGMKSGTHWLLYCSHQIRLKGASDADDLFPDVNLATPWPDALHYPGMTWQDAKDGMNSTHVMPEDRPWPYYWDNPRYPFRIFKTHFAPNVLPVTSFPGVKFLVICRNGLDVVRSALPFWDAHEEAFRKQWGGFPPRNNHADRPKEAMKNNVNDFTSGVFRDYYFGFVKKWWAARHEKNVLLLHFADTKKDLRKVVAQIAEFTNVDLNESELDIVTKRCGLDHMRSPAMKYRFRTRTIMDREDSVFLKPGKLVRSGAIGEGKDLIDPEDQEKFRLVEVEEFGSTEGLLEWARHGNNPST